MTLSAVVFALFAAQLAFLAPAAGAQSADRIAANLNDSGVFVESGAEGSAADFADVIARLAEVGVDLHIASLADDETDVEGLARSLRDKTGGTVLVITPGQLAGASDSFSDGDVLDAIDAAFDDFDNNVASGALSFGEALAGRRAPASAGSPTTTASTTATTNTTTAQTADVSQQASDSASSSGGGSGFGFLIFLVVVVGGVVALVMWLRSKNRKRVTAEMASRRAVVAAELEEIGVEIVDLSDKVPAGDDEEVTAHFRLANEQFLELQERLEDAASLWEITEVDHEADMTAWHLDAAAALLEGEPVPDEPKRPLDGPPAAPPRGLPEDRSHSDEGPGQDKRTDAGNTEGGNTDMPDNTRPDNRGRAADRERVTSRLDKRRSRTTSGKVPVPGRAPSTRANSTPRQQRRSERRETWPAPKVSGGGLGGALGGILKNVLVGGVLGGGGRSRSPRGWNGAGAVSSPSRPRRSTSRGSASRTRSRSGGGSASRSRSRSGGGSATRSRG